MKRIIYLSPLLALACAVAIVGDEDAPPTTREQVLYESPELRIISAASTLSLSIRYSGQDVTIPVSAPEGTLSVESSSTGELSISALEIQLGHLSAGEPGSLPGGFHLRNAVLKTNVTHWCHEIEWFGDEACQADIDLGVVFEAELRIDQSTWIPVEIPTATSLQIFLHSEGENLKAQISAVGGSKVGQTFPIALSGIRFDLVAQESDTWKPGTVVD